MIRACIAIVLVAHVLVGCERADTSRPAKIPATETAFNEMEIPGLSLGVSQAEVSERYGSPRSVRVEGNGSEVWTYDDFVESDWPLGGTEWSLPEEPRVVEEVAPRITQAPTLTELTHVQTIYSIYKGKAFRRGASLRFRGGKLSNVHVTFANKPSATDYLVRTIDADGNEIITFRD